MKIKIDKLKKSFGERVAVDIQQLTINQGDILGIVGNNGAGKTTLFRLMLDLLQADEGQVEFVPEECDGVKEPVNPALSEEWKSWTGALIDEGFLIDFLTPEEYLDFIAKANGLPASVWNEMLGKADDNGETEGAAEQADSLTDMLRRFSAGELFGNKKLIRELSAGNKQKIGILGAMLSRPKVLILDEPFNFLDPSSQNMLKKILTTFQRQTGATILVSSHNLQHTVDISTRVVLLEHGHVINDLDNREGAAHDVLDNYFEV